MSRILSVAAWFCRQLDLFGSTFGLAGPAVFAKYLLARSLRGVRTTSLPVPGSRRKVLVRCGASSDAVVWRQVFVERQYEIGHFPQAAWLEEAYSRAVAAGRAPLIVDCGANVGFSALFFALKYPAARIVAVEPDADNFAMLMRNVQELPNVAPIHAGIWDRPCRLAVRNPGAGSWALQVEESTAVSGSVEAVTIQDIVDHDGGGSAFIVKIDVEGSEAAVFRSRLDWMRRTALLTVEPHDWLLPGRGTSRGFFAALAACPSDVLIWGESLFCFLPSGAEVGAPASPAS